MTTPLLRGLRRSLPGAWITLVVKPAVRNLVELCPHVNEVLAFDASMGSAGPLRIRARALRFAWRHLRPRRFDLALVPRWDVDYCGSAFAAYFSGAPWRVGYSEKVTPLKSSLNRGYDLLYTHVLAKGTLKHEVERNLDLLRFAGLSSEFSDLELWIGPSDEAFAHRFLSKHGVGSEDLVVGIGPSGGNSPRKQWPLERFTEVGRWLIKEYCARLLILGGPGEEALAEEAWRALGAIAINTTGQTTLRQAAALIKRCVLYFGNDSGLMHIAAAVGTPVVAVFGPSCPHRFAPSGAMHTVIWAGAECSSCLGGSHPDRCRNCTDAPPQCLLNVGVEELKDAVRAKLAEGEKVPVAHAMS